LILVKTDRASFFQFENLTQYAAIRHGIFTRHFGYSTGVFQSLNVSFGLGDVADNVMANRRLIAQAIESEDLVFADQIHGDQVIVVSSQNSNSEMSTDRVVGIGDALVTDISGKFLIIQLADCQSVLLYDPIQRVVANVHCGWRGSLKNILERTVHVMHKCFQCNRTDIVAGIGPSLGPCCAEFVNYRNEIPEEFWRYRSADDHFDFWAISRDQLVAAGVLRENIETGNICTKCNSGAFFSYRAERQTGRFASVIGINRSTA
jgi:purine-nucleoside/S-methyl-5'-thioadenosine phosphorylase / adenosine deaminase